MLRFSIQARCLTTGSGGIIKLVKTIGAKDKKERKERNDKGKQREIYAGHKVKYPEGFLKYFYENYGKNKEFTEDFKKRTRESKKRNYWKNHEKVTQQRRGEYKERIKIDINFLVKQRVRNSFKNNLERYMLFRKIPSSTKYGINYKAIIEHLKPFPEDLSNYHIDHIRPLCSFNFVKEDGSTDLDEVKKAFAPENHQWLLAEDNMSKGGKWNGE